VWLLCNIPEDIILHSYRRENPKSYAFILALRISMCGLYISVTVLEL
jgi:hypothetical protein